MEFEKMLLTSMPKVICNFANVAVSILVLSSCAQQLLLRSSDFMVPKVGSEPLGGRVGVGLESPTGIDLYDDTNSQFPHITPRLSKSVPSAIGYIDAGFVILPYFEIYYLEQSLGVKWQFLNLGDEYRAFKAEYRAFKAPALNALYS